jgi:hypothetical protein
LLLAIVRADHGSFRLHETKKADEIATSKPAAGCGFGGRVEGYASVLTLWVSQKASLLG